MKDKEGNTCVQYCTNKQIYGFLVANPKLSGIREIRPEVSALLEPLMEMNQA